MSMTPPRPVRAPRPRPEGPHHAPGHPTRRHRDAARLLAGGIAALLLDPDDQARYRELATAGVAPGGHLILATFAADGPDHCSGPPVARHGLKALAE